MQTLVKAKKQKGIVNDIEVEDPALSYLTENKQLGKGKMRTTLREAELDVKRTQEVYKSRVEALSAMKVNTSSNTSTSIF